MSKVLVSKKNLTNIANAIKRKNIKMGGCGFMGYKRK